MTEPEAANRISRDRALQLGGLAGGLAVAGAPLLGSSSASAAASTASATATSSAAGLPVVEIERIIRAKGTVSNGVLDIQIDRNDLPHVMKQGVPIKPPFQINGDLCFQALPDGFHDAQRRPGLQAG